MHRKLLIALLLGVLPPSQAQPQSEPPNLRLDSSVRPVRYEAELSITPGEDTFSGHILIDLEFREPADRLWLNATGLTIEQARLTQNAETVATRPLPGNEDFVGFTFEELVEAGEARLAIRYQGHISRKDLHGIFQVQEDSTWYVFTHFEPLAARRAFPCFDEPSFKAPWQLSLRVPDNQVAFSNTPGAAEPTRGNGMQTFRFAETKPLPSYLVALAVGPFDVVEAGKAGRKSTPLRIITPRGKSSEAEYAVRTTPELLERVEDYFGMPYPFEKLDSIAMPIKPQAMEHPGLLSYPRSLLLAQPEKDFIQRRRQFAVTCSHELAHQWFGNLVTLAWWDDLWLNEAFATWLADKIVDGWRPGWERAVGKLAFRSTAMNADSLPSARPIRQPIRSQRDIVNAFDTLTYHKGQAVLDMFESWIGEATFRRGVRRYLEKWAWGNATAADLLAALSHEAETDIAPAFSTFLDQPGVPLVSINMDCQQDAGPVLALSQQRYLPAEPRASNAQTWRIPICIQYPTGEDFARICRLLAEPKERWELADAAECPPWILGNDEQAGYYRTLYEGDLLESLVKQGREHLTLPELVGTIRDMNALIRGGEVPAGDALALIPELVRDTSSRHVISSTLGIMAAVEPIVPENLRSNFARYIRSTYGRRARKLGWEPGPGEDDETQLLRRTVVRRVAIDGRDETLLAQAHRLARKWLEDRSAIEPDLLSAVLQTAATEGDRELFEAFVSELRETPSRSERASLFAAIGAFRDPEIVQSALELLWRDDLDIRESFRILMVVGTQAETRSLGYAFVKNNFEQLARRLPENPPMGAWLPRIGAMFCDETRRRDLEAFFETRVPRFASGPRMLADTLERIDACLGFKKHQQDSLARSLREF